MDIVDWLLICQWILYGLSIIQSNPIQSSWRCHQKISETPWFCTVSRVFCHKIKNASSSSSCPLPCSPYDRTYPYFARDCDMMLLASASLQLNYWYDRNIFDHSTVKVNSKVYSWILFMKTHSPCEDTSFDLHEDIISLHELLSMSDIP